jgi:hypothetical protein
VSVDWKLSEKDAAAVGLDRAEVYE